MPRELLGDHSYHAALRRLGIKNPGEVPVGIPVRLTAKVDDLSHLSIPLGLDFWGVGVQVAAVIGNRSGFVIKAGNGGLWWQCHCSEFVDIFVDNTSALPGELFAIARPLGGDAAVGTALPLARTSTINGAAGTLPTAGNAFKFTGNGGIDSWCFPQEIYLGPGQRLIFKQAILNDVFDFSIRWREVPSAGG